MRGPSAAAWPSRLVSDAQWSMPSKAPALFPQQEAIKTTARQNYNRNNVGAQSLQLLGAQSQKHAAHQKRQQVLEKPAITYIYPSISHCKAINLDKHTWKTVSSKKNRLLDGETSLHTPNYTDIIFHHFFLIWTCNMGGTYSSKLLALNNVHFIPCHYRTL